MFVASVPGDKLRLRSGLGYHDPVYAPDGTPEGAQTALPAYAASDINMPLVIALLGLLYLMSKG